MKTNINNFFRFLIGDYSGEKMSMLEAQQIDVTIVETGMDDVDTDMYVIDANGILAMSNDNVIVDITEGKCEGSHGFYIEFDDGLKLFTESSNDMADFIIEQMILFVSWLGFEFDENKFKYEQGDDEFPSIYSYDLGDAELTNDQIVAIGNFEDEMNNHDKFFIDIEYKGKY